MGAKKNKRPPIPDAVRIQVWTEAAGRCQFRNCNTPLWYNTLTLNQTNFADMAHIIGASEDGPRGGEDSEKLAKDPDNILLACKRCHKEIDDSKTRGNYDADVLRTMKKEHCDRVRWLLDQPSKRTRPLILKTEIASQQSPFSERSIKKSILPDYPDAPSPEWHRIELPNFDRNQPDQWTYAISVIDNQVAAVNRSIANGGITHLSVYALAAQPLLMYLGRVIGDKTPAQVYEPRRTDDQDKVWQWDNEGGASVMFRTEKVQEGSSKEAVLLLSLSDYLGTDKYGSLVTVDTHVYRLYIDAPVQGFLKKRSEKAAFISTARALLNQIQYEVGADCKVHVLTAAPASLSVEFGRLIQPTKDPTIWVYEYLPDKGPVMVLELN